MDLSADRSRLDFFLARQQQPQQQQSGRAAAVKREPSLQAGALVKAEEASACPAAEAAAGEELSDCSCAAAESWREAGQAAAPGEADRIMADARPEAGPEADEGGELAAVDVTQQQRMLRIFEARHKRQRAAVAASGNKPAKRPATLAAFFSPKACAPGAL